MALELKKTWIYLQRTSNDVEFLVEVLNGFHTIQGIDLGGGSSMYTQGVRNGDVIVSIDGISVANKCLSEVVMLLKKNLYMALTVLRVKNNAQTDPNDDAIHDCNVLKENMNMNLHSLLSGSRLKKTPHDGMPEHYPGGVKIAQDGVSSDSEPISRSNLCNRGNLRVSYNKIGLDTDNFMAKKTPRKVSHLSLPLKQIPTKADSFQDPPTTSSTTSRFGHFPINNSGGNSDDISVSSFRSRTRSLKQKDSIFKARAPSLCVSSVTEDIWELNINEEFFNLSPNTYNKDQAKTKVNSKALKRIQIIIEFFNNELTFTIVLSLLGKYFYEPILNGNLMSLRDLDYLFPNLKELLELHKSFLNKMMFAIEKKCIDDKFPEIVYDEFAGERASQVESAWCEFFRNQVIGRENLKNLRENCTKLRNFLNVTESNPVLKKSKLTDLLQRIHKHIVEYPIFIERVISNTPPIQEGYQKLKDALSGIKKILENVDEKIQLSQNTHIMEKCSDVIKLKRSERHNAALFPKDFTFEDQKLIKYGCLYLINKIGKISECEAILTNNYLVFFRKTSMGYSLRPFEMATTVSNQKCSNFIICLDRINAVKPVNNISGDKAFFLFAQDHFDISFICNLSTPSKDKRTEWIAAIRNLIGDRELDSKDDILSSRMLPRAAAPEDTTTGFDTEGRSSPSLSPSTSLFRVHSETNTNLSPNYLNAEFLRIVRRKNQLFLATEKEFLFNNVSLWDSCLGKMCLLIESVEDEQSDLVKSHIRSLMEDLNQLMLVGPRDSKLERLHSSSSQPVFMESIEENSKTDGVVNCASMPSLELTTNINESTTGCYWSDEEEDLETTTMVVISSPTTRCESLPSPIEKQDDFSDL